MNIYSVVRKADGVNEFTYPSDVPLPLLGYGMDTHTHTVIGETSGDWKITKRAFWNRLPAYNETAMRAVIITGSPVLLAASLRRLEARIEDSPHVDLRLQETIEGLYGLASAATPQYVTIEGQTLPLRITVPQFLSVVNTIPQDKELATQREIVVEAPISEPALNTAAAVVYKVGDNFVTMLKTEQPPVEYEHAWDISPVTYTLILEGAGISVEDGSLVIRGRAV